MIQDIGSKVYNSEFIKKYPEIDDIIMFFQGRDILVKKNGEEYEFPTFADTKISELFDKDGKIDQNTWREKVRNIYGDMEILRTITIDDQGYYLVNERGIFSDDIELEMVSNEILRHFEPLEEAFGGATVLQLYRWYEGNRFCGKCGKPMKPSEKERAIVCDECGYMVFPKICPAITAAVIDGDRILLIRHSGGPFRRYALVAGYVEIGETFEDTVKREIKEEVGLNVKNIKYYKNQPWALSDTQMIGFTCELDGDDRTTIQEEELQEARWFTADEIPPDIADRSLTYEIIGNFRKEKINKTGETGKYKEFEHIFDRGKR